MCDAICECLKCPGKVLCCCCECACKVIFWWLFSMIILGVVIFLIVYFTVIHKDKGSPEQNAKMVEPLMDQVPHTFKQYFKSLQ